MTDTDTTNGNGPSPRALEIAQYIDGHKAERDSFAAEVMRLKTEMAGYKVALEAKDAQIAEIESRMQTAYAVRDEAVALREKYLAVCMSVNALMHTFEIPNAPLVREIPTDEVSTIGGA